MVDDLASEPKEKHAFHVTSFENVSSTSVTNRILKTVAETPTKAEVSNCFLLCLTAVVVFYFFFDLCSKKYLRFSLNRIAVGLH